MKKQALKILRELINDGLDAKNFLNDILEVLYLFSKRLNLGSIEKDMTVSESDTQLVDQYSKNIDIVFKLWMTIILITIIDLYVQFFFGQNLLGFKSPWNARLSGFFDQELKVAHLLIGFFLPSFAYFFQKNVKNFYLFAI